MLTDGIQFFERYFPLLTDRKTAYPWQRDLYGQMICGDLPDSLGLPTGAGKTTILPLWLLALAWTSVADPKIGLPRRIVWVVNRRVVVDQATEEAKLILAALASLAESDRNDDLIEALRTLSGTDRLLAVSTLRGERADNRDWSRNPSVPAIIIGTVDMVGSRLLFRGYGDGRYWRPYHAGLLGVDALIVNDESHLSPAFARLLIGIRNTQPAARTGLNFHVMLVSATERGLGDKPFLHSLAEDLGANEQFRRIYEAEKHLWLEESADHQAAAHRLVALALHQPAARTIVFVEKPEEALDVARQLEKAAGAGRVALLTGTMRGLERDRLTQSAAFGAFQKAPLPAESAYLVTTSAGEVGVNVSGERLVTLLTESDHLLQRFGRLNRFGDREGDPHRIGQAYVVFVEPKAKEAETARRKTLDYLRGLPVRGDGWRDISCRALHECQAPPETRSAEPLIAAFHPWLFDVWAQTSLPNQSVPQVEPWLHGKQEGQYPETSVAWRAEVEWLGGSDMDDEDRSRALEGYRVLARERLTEPTDRVKEKLGRIAELMPDTVALWVSPDGEVKALTITELAQQDLRYGLVLLPPGCGWLDRGMFRDTPCQPDAAAYDVADEREPDEGERRRYLVTGMEDDWRWHRIGSVADEEAFGPNPQDVTALRQFAVERALGKPIRIRIPDAVETEGLPARYLILFTAKPSVRSGFRAVDLDEHSEAVERCVKELGRKLLGGPIPAWLEEAARLHDLGKGHELWQRAMGGDIDQPLAKTPVARAPQWLAGFRHELHSLVLARKHVSCDAVLHLIASHHGWARPHWETRAYDRGHPEASEIAALEAARRFGGMQTEWGHWGLAYMEAILKAADGMASEEGENA
jgi:CRISPR-associated endonuclease/helicase Cas3